MPERTFWLAFERERSRMLGALFDMVAHGLRELPTVHLESLPRLADFALWITACERARHGQKARSWRRFEANRRGPVDTVLEADPVASAVRALMATRDRWAGTASGLLGALAEHVDDATRRGKAWPATPRALSARLRRAATFLRKVGVTIEFLRQGHEKARLICIEGKSAGGGTEIGDFASAPSASSETGHKTMKQHGLFANANADAKSTADANADGIREFCVRAQPKENKGNADARTVRTQTFPFFRGADSPSPEDDDLIWE
jgi:hypothetical protein